MRCPECEKICSDLRDICPHCLKDLREKKREGGIPITNPDASYDDLVANLKSKSYKPAIFSSVVSAAHNLRGIFARPNASEEMQDNESAVDEYLDAAISETIDSVQAIEEAQSEPKPEMAAAHIAEELLEESPEVAAASLTEPPPGPPVEAIAEEPPPPPAQEEVAPPKIEVAAQLANPQETSLLFQSAFDDIKQYVPDDLEFAAKSLGQRYETKAIEVLFDLAKEAIEKPETAGRYLEAVPTSEQVTVENSSLERILQRVEGAIRAKAEQFSSFKRDPRKVLASLLRSGTGDEAAAAVVGRKIEVAGLPRRFLSFLIDSIVICAIGVCLAFAGGYIYYQDAYREVISAGSRDAIYTVPLIGLFLICALSAALILPAILLSIYRTTLGMRIAHIKLVQHSGARPTVRQLLTWAFSLPASWLFLGFTGLFTANKQTLHDWVADIKMVND